MSQEYNTNDELKKLILIDGCGLLFKAYYGIPQILAKDYTPVGAIYGFIRSLKMLMKYFTSFNSNLYLAVALDTANRKTKIRYQMYSKYKGNRSSTPQDLIAQLQLVRVMLDVFGINLLEDETGEADDVIASYTRHAVNSGFETIIVSNDKDLMQLISDKVKFYDINKKRLCYSTDIIERFGVNSEQIVDFLSMVGDKSDNIPGIKGIGSKTASQLINQYGSLEGIYNNLYKIKSNKIRHYLSSGYAQAQFAKSLIKLNEDLIIKHELESFKWHGFKAKESGIKAFLHKYSLESLIWIIK
jgi:DNA polymerase-1